MNHKKYAQDPPFPVSTKQKGTKEPNKANIEIVETVHQKAFEELEKQSSKSK